jgi:tetratricopeptide (TPR) repeat protein
LSTQPEKSLNIANELLVEHSANYLLWVIAARAHQRLGQFVQAGECVDKALKIDPNNAEAIYAKSDLLYRSDRLNDAEKYLIEAIARLDTNSARPLRLLYATVLQKAKKYEEAQALYKQLTRCPSSSRLARKSISRAWWISSKCAPSSGTTRPRG